ncbi:MAG: hemolysin III family protein [Chloroflexota bacterium]|nr:hemolysin III family protein [Chloroflexota bacterium]
MAARLKPRLRGVLHEYSFFVSVGSGVMLVLTSSPDLARLASVVYASALAGLFGVSALYHRVTWPPRAGAWMRRLDHAMIFLLIAGTYTPIALLMLPRPKGLLLLALVWGASLAGIAFNLAWINAPRLISPALYVVLGWIAVVALPDLRSSVSLPTLVLLTSGGLVYSVGAVVYATRRPNPAPAVFGYHEVFHALTIAAASMHFAAVASVVLPSTS